MIKEMNEKSGITLDDFENGKIHKINKVGKLFGPNQLPAVALINPKFTHNIGQSIRAASLFGAKTLFFTGNRVITNLEEKQEKKYRFPREERMKEYKKVLVLHDDYFLERFNCDISPVAIEKRQNSERLPYFKHPKNAIYVFGPEDGSIPKSYLQHCHSFVLIPVESCLNLAAAVNVTLYDRKSKEFCNG